MIIYWIINLSLYCKKTKHAKCLKNCNNYILIVVIGYITIFIFGHRNARTVIIYLYPNLIRNLSLPYRYQKTTWTYLERFIRYTLLLLVFLILCITPALVFLILSVTPALSLVCELNKLAKLLKNEQHFSAFLLIIVFIFC